MVQHSQVHKQSRSTTHRNSPRSILLICRKPAISVGMLPVNSQLLIASRVIADMTKISLGMEPLTEMHGIIA